MQSYLSLILLTIAIQAHWKICASMVTFIPFTKYYDLHDQNFHLESLIFHKITCTMLCYVLKTNLACRKIWKPILFSTIPCFETATKPVEKHVISVLQKHLHKHVFSMISILFCPWKFANVTAVFEGVYYHMMAKK